MEGLYQLISILSKDERRGFISYLETRNKRHDSKNIELFKLVLAGKTDDLRKQIGSNAFNVLKKRVKDRLLDYLALTSLNLHSASELDYYKSIALSQRLLNAAVYKLGFKVLLEAEIKAISENAFGALQMIYHTLIEFSYLENAPDQKELYYKMKTNQKRALEQENLNLIYARAKKAFLDHEHLGNKVNVAKMLKGVIDDFPMIEKGQLGYQAMNKLAQIVDLYGAFSRNYHSIDLFFEDRIEELDRSGQDIIQDLPYKIDLLYTIANIYFRKKEFEQSEEFLKRMLIEMDKRKDLYERNLIRYSTLIAMNLHFTNRTSEALEKLSIALNSEQYKKEDRYLIDLVRIMIYFHLGDMKTSRSLLSKYQQSDSHYRKVIGLDGVMHMKLMEILLHIDLGNLDYVDSLLRNFRSKYRNELVAQKNEAALPFIKLVLKYLKDPMTVKAISFYDKVESTIPWKQFEEEDIFFICFYAWLKAKMDNTDLYQVTLELLKKKPNHEA